MLFIICTYDVIRMDVNIKKMRSDYVHIAPVSQTWGSV